MATPQSVSFFAPGSEAGLDYNQVQRQRQMAEAMMQSAFNPQGGQMVSGHYVAPGAMSYVNQLVGALAGRAMQERADQSERSILQKAQQQRADEASSFMNAMTGKPAGNVPMAVQNDDEGNPLPVVQTAAQAPDRNRAMAIALQSSNPALQSMGGDLIKQQMQQQQLADLIQKYGGGGGGGGGASAPGAAPGAGGASGSGGAAGAPGAPAGGGFGGVNPLAFALAGAGFDKLGGMVADANKPIALREGDLVTPNGAGGVNVMYSQPKLPPGMVPTRDGQGKVTGAQVLPGFTGGTAAIAGAERGAQEAAADAYKSPTLVDSPSGPRLMTPAQQRAAATGSAPSGVAPLPGYQSEPAMRATVQGDMGAAPGAIDREIAYLQRDREKVPDASSKAMIDQEIARLTAQRAQYGTGGAGAGRGGQGGPGIPVQSEEAKAYNVTRAKGFAEQAMGWQKASQQAAGTLRNLDQLETLYKDPNVAKGALAENISGLKNIGASFGMDLKGLSSEQAAEAITNKMALEARSTADGGGMPGAMSDSDRSFLQNMQPGLTKTPEGRQQIIDAARKVAQRQIDVARLASDYEQRNGQIDAGFDRVLQDYAAKNQMFTQAKPGGGFKIIGVR